MFQWNVEELRLYKLSSTLYQFRIQGFPDECRLTLDCKKEFLNRITNNDLSEIIEFMKSYHYAITHNIIKLNVYGSPKQSSLMSWVRSNNKEELYDENGFFPKNSFYIFPETNISISIAGLFLCYDKLYKSVKHLTDITLIDDINGIIEEFINNAFHNSLISLYLAECDWYDSHDELTILQNHLKHNKILYNILPNTVYVRDGNIVYRSNDQIISVNDCKKILRAYNKIENYINSIKSELILDGG